MTAKLIDFSKVDNISTTGVKTRQSMVEQLAISCTSVKAVMINTPRHYFIDEALSYHAYRNISLPIGYGQTISQPQVVALMSSALIDNSTSTNSVLEIGTGCGYQAAILAQLFDVVYSIERIAKLYQSAKQRFKELGIDNIHCFHSDGSNLQKKQKFDAIMFTAAAEKIPQNVIQLLAKGSCLVAPEGRQNDDGQRLVKIVFDGRDYHKTEIGWVDFVPLLSGLVG